MTLTEILPSLKQLNHREKLKAVQFLVNEMVRTEETDFAGNLRYDFQSQTNSFGVAEALLKLLEEENEKSKS